MIGRSCHELFKFIHHNSIKVLLYHRINYENYGINPNLFESQIRYLKRTYNILNLNEFISILNGNLTVKDGLVITLDDGYKDNYDLAFPILKKYAVPAIIFLSTDFIDGKMWFWQDMYRYIIQKTPFEKVELTLGQREYKFNLGTEMDKLRARKLIYRKFRLLSIEERSEQIESLAELLSVQLPDEAPREYAPMSWDNVKTLSKNGIEFGAHTCSHEILTSLSLKDAFLEISESKNKIENILQVETAAFAYPNGQKGDFSDEIKMIVHQCGYKVAFTTLKGFNNKSLDRFAIKRIYPPHDNALSLDAELSGYILFKEKVLNLLLMK